MTYWRGTYCHHSLLRNIIRRRATPLQRCYVLTTYSELVTNGQHVDQNCPKSKKRNKKQIFSLEMCEKSKYEAMITVLQTREKSSTSIRPASRCNYRVQPSGSIDYVEIEKEKC